MQVEAFGWHLDKSSRVPTSGIRPCHFLVGSARSANDEHFVTLRNAGCRIALNSSMRAYEPRIKTLSKEKRFEDRDVRIRRYESCSHQEKHLNL